MRGIHTISYKLIATFRISSDCKKRRKKKGHHLVMFSMIGKTALVKLEARF